MLATHFYSSLLEVEEMSATTRKSRQRALRHVQQTLTNQMRMRLLASFIEIELLDALRDLPRDKCHWDVLKEGPQLAFQEMMDKGSMLESLTEGVILLIPKEGGDQDDI